MQRHVPYILCLALLSTVASGAEDTFVRKELLANTDRKLNTDPRHPLLQIRAFVEYEPVQPARAGMMLVIELANEGPEPLELVKVLEGINITVYNAAGVQVEVPDGRIGEIILMAGGQCVRRDPLKSPTFDFIHPPRAWREQEIKVLQEAIDRLEPGSRLEHGIRAERSRIGYNIRLEPGEKFQTGLVVRKILCEPEAYWERRKKFSVPIEQAPPDIKPAGPPATCDIPPGKYDVAINVGVSLKDLLPWSFSLPDYRLSIELVGPPKPQE